VSQATRDDLIRVGVDPAAVSVVFSGLDVLRSTERPDPVGPPTLCVLGRLVPNKRVELAIDALARLTPEFPDLRLEVLGQGYWLASLQDYAAARGVADRVRFAGFVSEEEKVSVLATSQVNLLPSVKEGWGLVVIEAAAQGTPTVAFREAGGVSESVLDGVTGLLASDPDDFVARIALLLRDDEQRRQLGEKAREHADQFDWEHTTDSFEAVLQRVARPARGGDGPTQLVP
jgi:glycosyltransferase involved in cell wall biosynthesis